MNIQLGITHYISMEIKEARLQNVKNMKVNITAGLDISPDESAFAIVSRYTNENSTINHYQIEQYNLETLKRTNIQQIYASYNVLNHPCLYLPDGNTIVVVTINHIIFYNRNLTQKHREVHGQLNVYDIQSSPDSRLVALVGNLKILIWDTNSYARVIFINQNRQITSKCRFSQDGRYFGFVSDRNIKIYKIVASSGTYLFDQTQTTSNLDEGKLKQMQSYGSIGTFDFNPTNSREIVIGFSNSSPKKFNFDSKQITSVATEEQPNYQESLKVVRYFPDGKRVFSSDNIGGVGYWPGEPTKHLVYHDKELMLDFRLFRNGRKVIGRVWETLKIIQVQFGCESGKFSTSCQCGTTQYWDMSNQSCRPCVQGDKNICLCSASQTFKAELGGCVYDCSKATHTINNIYSFNLPVPCFCQPGFSWKNGQCVFDCSEGISAGEAPLTCICKPGYTWNNINKRCECPLNKRLFKAQDQQPICQCLDNYVQSESGQCIVDCTKIRYTTGTDASNNTCTCAPNFAFATYDNETGTSYQMLINNDTNLILGAKISYCVLNCSTIAHTQGVQAFDKCLCTENRVWDGEKCVLDCKSIKNGVERIVNDTTGVQACKCSMTYSWVYQNEECGRNCTGVKYVDLVNRYSTASSCPCIQNFGWTVDPVTQVQQCVIDCEKVKYSEPYSIGSSNKCSCRTLFVWNDSSTKCQVNCSEIWDAEDRVGDGECACKSDKIFNSTSMTCVVGSIEGVFSKPWVWAVLGVGALFGTFGLILVLIVAIVMIKFCWKFKSDRAKNKEHNKTLKKNTQPKIRKKKMNQQNIIATSERAELNKY